jgi:hypothetical protein
MAKKIGKEIVKEAKNGFKNDGGERKENTWVRFVSDFAISRGISYACALGENFAELQKEYRKKTKNKITKKDLGKK